MIAIVCAGPEANPESHLALVVLSLDSFNLEHFQVGVSMFLLYIFFFLETLTPMRAGAQPVLPSIVPGTEPIPSIQTNK